MKARNGAVRRIFEKIREYEQGAPLSFTEFTDLASETPERIFRNIFQIFFDMVYAHVGDGVNEYPDDPESIKYVYYDTHSLFEDGVDYPFFADRLFANRFIKHVASFKRGAHQNRLYIFEGPHGCGKSTFLNNLLMKFEAYTRTDEGATYETVWRLNKKELGMLPEHETHSLLLQLRGLVNGGTSPAQVDAKEVVQGLANPDYLELPCPSHDHPFLLIPKRYRKELLDDLIREEEFKKKLFFKKEYEWVFRDSPCTICMTLYQILLDRCHSPASVYDMIYARRYQFNRRLGEGISVFNPGDVLPKTHVVSNPMLQNQLNSLLRDSNRVPYIYSRFAKTNNGVYALMDVKAQNRERFSNLHNIISEGVHKVEDIEENVNSLFLAIINPEDRENINEMQSFADRITYIKIPYVLDYNTEVKIYRKVFGDQIESHFLPRVLQNLAKVIISSRLKSKSGALEEWISDPVKYRLYCDRDLHLLKMDIYTGLIPPWLTEDDRKDFTAKRRRRIIAESESEGDKGFSGRDSISIFNDFYSTYSKKDKLVNMAMVYSFFKNHRPNLLANIPDGFLDSLVCFYNYTVLQEVKESLYYYNEARISRDIQNYLFAVNFEIGGSVRCVYTGEDLEITEAFLQGREQEILGPNAGNGQSRAFREDVQNQYTSKTLTREMMVEGKAITETQLYRQLHERYVHNLKEKVLDPFLENDNFRNAIKDYATEPFKSYDKRIREEVSLLIENLTRKYGYTEQGAKEVCIYVVDNDLARTFSQSSA
jgi:predicted Ser/Thr protein kinase